MTRLQDRTAALLGIILFLLSACRSEPSSQGGLPAALEHAGYRQGDAMSVQVKRVIGTDTFLDKPLPMGTIFSKEHERLFVADAGYSWIWVFGSTGDSLRVIGERGEGPEEFQYLDALALKGDTLYARGGPGIVTEIVVEADSDPTFAGRFQKETLGNRLPGNLYPIKGGGFWSVYMRPHNPFFDDPSAWVVRLNAEGNVIADSLSKMPLPESGVEMKNRGVYTAEIPFAREPVYAGHPDGRFCFAWTGAYRIECLSPSSASEEETTVLFEADVPLVPASSDERRVYMDRYSEERRRIAEKGPSHDTYPAFDAMQFDTLGRLWLSEPVRPSAYPDGPVTWYVLDLEERTYRTTELPYGHEVVSATTEYVYTNAFPHRSHVGVFSVSTSSD